jgi:hypothetical protein
VSIWIGRRTQQDHRWLWYVVPLNVVAAIIVPTWLAASFVGGPSGIFNNYNDYRGSSSNYNPPANGLTLDGSSISNIYPFDDQGKQVHVRLYNQDGQPINLQRQDCATTYGVTRPANETSNFFPLVAVQDDPNNGYVDAENCKDSDKAPFVPPPAPATPTTPSPTPGNSVTPTPSTTPTAGTSTKPSTPATPKPGATLTVSPSR